MITRQLVHTGGFLVVGFAAVSVLAAGRGHQADKASAPRAALGPVEYRTIDGVGNNVANPLWGAANVKLIRAMGSDYADSISMPSGADRPSAREISNIVCAQDLGVPNAARATSYIWQWGQFIDHDLSLTEGAHPVEPMDIPVPTGDPWFDPAHTGTQVIFLNRSEFDPATGLPGIPRAQVNQLTAFVDASMVYGSDAVRAVALRTNDGTGRLAESDPGLLPYNTGGLPNGGGPDPGLFLAGDVRVNEQLCLIAIHTLFMREHNRLADEILLANPGLTGDEVYERARQVVAALIQVITYEEFLPLLLGPSALPPYAGYDDSVDPGIMNEFSTACFRVGHTMLPPEFLRLAGDGSETPEGRISLADAFFTPTTLVDEGGIDPLLRGLAVQPAQEVDRLITDSVRNFLFGPPGAGGFDLVALNLQRGRDHGLPGYNAARVAMGLPAAVDFTDISSNPEVQSRLQAAYGDVDKIDMWIGGIAEDHVPDAMVGELFHSVIADQFRRLRDGDRFWYENTFSPAMATALKATTLADVIRRNTDIDDEISDTVFELPVCPWDCAPPAGNGEVNFDDLVAIVNAITTQDLDCDVAPDNGDGTFGDGSVDVDDLLAVVNNFGLCL